MEEKELFERLRRFILKEAFLSDIEITNSTVIETELGITGDDADDFIYAFSKEFNVDVSNFHIGKYFKGEGDTTVINFINFFNKNKPLDCPSELTVGHLKKAIKVGRLDDSIFGNSM